MKNTLFWKGLVVGIIVLLIEISIIPSSGFQIENKPINLSDRSNTLYVGGNGSGNYSEIQDAIDNASDGDTVFVYSGIYYENVRICKSISLIGEDRDTTVIDGDYKEDVVNVSADWINISRFTIRRAGHSWDSGIDICSNNNTIKDNIISGNCYGITFSEFSESDSNTITGNNITNNGIGIVSLYGNFNNISGNIIRNSQHYGVLLYHSSNNIIYGNIIKKGFRGIMLQDLNYNNMIKLNHISECYNGIEIACSLNNRITQNNIFENEEYQATFYLDFITIFSEIFNHPEYKLFGRNIWDKNYWGEKRLLPYPIFGKLGYLFSYLIDSFNTVSFDWHPAKEPYDI